MGWEAGNEAHRAEVLRLLEGFRKCRTPVDALGVQSHLGTEAIFDHYLFEANGDPAAHILTDRKGVLGPLSPWLAQTVRAYLKRGPG